MSNYSEKPPSFTAGFDAVIIVAEEIAFQDSNPIIPERIAVKLRSRRLHTNLPSLGTRDPIEFMHQLAEAAPEYLDKLDEVYREIEQDWAVENLARSRSGLRELVLHLSASKVPVVFTSIKNEDVARNAIRTGMKLATGYTTIGREKYSEASESYGTAITNAIKALPPGTRAVVIVHNKIASTNALESAASDLIKIGYDSRSDGAEDNSPSVDILDLALQCELMTSEAAALKKAKNARSRIFEIQKKGTSSGLSSAELAELGDLTGGLLHIGNAQEFGFVDQKVGTDNAWRIGITRTLAAKGQHLLEVVSIDAALIEIELRNWLIIHRSRGFQTAERITFGQTVQLAESNGFPSGLISRLRTFNNLRNDAVHHLARGVASYEKLMDQYMEDCSLLFDTKDFVRDSAPHIGVKTTPVYE
ncbi:hypothetical protein [Nocardia salmonicida]|uniref:hypothetical protein n=1 Tax=Nocardia salmonicida TaxID=53431 RepID=UPI0010428232|nr:hypothetical protein [Nocardia salmonicida]